MKKFIGQVGILGKSIGELINAVDGFYDGLRNLSLRFISCMKGIVKNSLISS